MRFYRCNRSPNRCSTVLVEGGAADGIYGSTPA
jgi:hypothetical protein